MNDVATNGELDIDYIAGKLATTRIRHSDEMAMDGPAYCRWPNCSRGESFWTQRWVRAVEWRHCCSQTDWPLVKRPGLDPLHRRGNLAGARPRVSIFSRSRSCRPASRRK